MPEAGDRENKDKGVASSCGGRRGHWDQLGELAEVLGGGGEVEFIAHRSARAIAVLSALAPGGGYQSSWGTLLLVLGDEAECGARRVDQRPSGIGLSARRKAIAGSAAVTAASSSTSAVPAF